jgi:cycloeucalenol cycloisomerase|tara:strand:- start:3412 stop:4386 length:975 start_codon:yes stop_codon:yes gene_type:complete|mmetsp:Transcript_3852/g.12953  ORF Transcript_3852/g.12953 Transcript_3852/m.12953 type:complete len:325 (+) Transcript_3852:171-1145(+)
MPSFSSLAPAVPEVWVTMAKIFATLFAICGSLAMTLTPVPAAKTKRGASKAKGKSVVTGWLCDKSSNPSKHHAEAFILKVSAGWIASVGFVIFFGWYEWWGPWGYLGYCVSCAAPYIVVPLFKPLGGDILKDGSVRPRSEQYVLKANAWIAIFSFVGNYWYTHYFYQVLHAKYTFHAHRLNDVPIALYFMTHAYFMFYHVLSSCALRRVKTGYEKNAARLLFTSALVASLAYTTAFMESLTICGFPYYEFENRDVAYTLGSAFYGIYFLVSFPVFLALDEGKDTKDKINLAQVFWQAMGVGMFVLCLLDFVRLYLGLDFVMKVT